ncbi:MAG: glycosyltransferase family 4 protein [Planctomycetota bacterium]
MRTLILATRPTQSDRCDPAPCGLLVQTLVERGHDVHLVCSADEPLRSYEALTVWPVHASRSPGTPAFATRAFEAAKAASPECVICERPHLALGRAVAARAKASFVPLLTDRDPCKLTPVRRVQASLDDRLLRAADLCIAAGPLQADTAMTRGARRVIELPGVSGITPIDQPPSGWLRRHLGLTEGILAIAWGELSPEAGTDVLIEGVKVAADADVDIHAAIFGGDETSIDRYEAKAERLGVFNRVHLLGGWSAAKLGTLLPEADILVEPSLEPSRTPRSLYSFMASHRPVLLAELPGRERLIKPGACAIAPGDRLGMGHVLAELATHPEMRSRYAQAASETARAEHSSNAFAGALDQFERLFTGPEVIDTNTDSASASHSIGR